MEVLSRKFRGSIIECTGCQAILAYNINDIYQNKYVYCPLCKTKLETKINLEYDGEVQDLKKE